MSIQVLVTIDILIGHHKWLLDNEDNIQYYIAITMRQTTD